MRKRLAFAAVVLVALGTVPHQPSHTEAVAASAPQPVEVLARVTQPVTTSTTTTSTTPATTSTTAPVTTTTAPDPPTGDNTADAIHAAFGDGPLFTEAWNVSGCESTHRPNATSAGNYGLFQISSVHADAFEEVTHVRFADGWSDAYLNAQYARYLHDQSGGWGPWGCRWAA